MSAFSMLFIVTSFVLSGCDQTSSSVAGNNAPSAAELGVNDIGYYCNMIVQDHSGPKGQVFLVGEDKPLWFASVRDTFAFTRLPGEPKNIAAIYVTDMGRASWDKPEPGTWVEGHNAWYVIGSGRKGGMGAVELVPFSERDAAQRFATDYGGRVVAFDAVPDNEVIGAVVAPQPAVHAEQSTHSQSSASTEAIHGGHSAKMSESAVLPVVMSDHERHAQSMPPNTEHGHAKMPVSKEVSQ